LNKIAYFSPLNPIRSGISDYSEDLLPELAKYYDIDVYVPNSFIIENEAIRGNFSIKFYSEYEQNYFGKMYAVVLYHMGNNYEAHKGIYDFILKCPGIVVLHDYSLHHFFAAKTLEHGDVQSYLDEMFYCHGDDGLREANRFINGEIAPIWEHNSLNYPLNLRILDHSAGIIVHSEFAKSLLQEQASYIPISVVPLPAPYISKWNDIEKEKQKAREQLNIDKDIFVLCAVGFANPTKRIDKIISALAYIKSNKLIKNFKFYIVGEISPTYPIDDLIKKNKLQDEVVCTGFVGLDVFDQYIAASDMCLNLRYPTQGENSASLLKIMGHGKPVITTNIGSFSEFPDDVVYKVPYQGEEVKKLTEYILQIYGLDRNVLANDIIIYTLQSHSMEVCRARYKDFVSQVRNGEKVGLNLGLKEVLQRYINIMSRELSGANLNYCIDKNVTELIKAFNHVTEVR
jgi:glycosyltransferase involved in cell wall biosynthesis